MEERRFDDLTRALGRATSRRQVLKGLLAAAVASVAAAAKGPVHVQAAGTCLDAAGLAACEAAAQSRFVYQVKNCRGLGKVGGGESGGLGARFGCTLQAEYQLQSDLSHCRMQGCPTGLTCCAGGCVDTHRDLANCGACGQACAPGEICADGRCLCPPPGIECAGTCTQIMTDPAHCGSCSHACAAGERCVLGTCVCPPPLQLCGETCVDLETDPANCGSCGHACESCQTCVNGSCAALDCGAGQICCGEQCVSNQCPSGKAFSLATCTCQCTSSCPPGQQQDPDTCQCGNLCDQVTCGACQVCNPATGQCDSTCTAGQVCCDGSCQASCGECTEPKLPCSNGDCCDNSTDYACCQNGCCEKRTTPSGTGAFCTGPNASCCPPGTPVVLVGCMSGGICSPFSVVIDDTPTVPTSCGAGDISEWSDYCSDLCVVETLNE